MEYLWNILDDSYVDSIDDILEILCKNRGIDNIDDFLDTNINKLYDPYLFKDMDKVVKRINSSIEKDELIFIYGDYDSDGITSTSIMINTIKRLGGKVDYFIPNRFDDGYGLNLEALEVIIKKEPKLIITVDCGINAHDEINYINSFGIDIIISDHHEISYPLPNAYAIIHPLNKYDTYPCNCLSGAGVAFKISNALIDKDAFDYLDLAMIGTVSDAVNIFWENRIIISNGLKFIKQSRNLGLRSLIKNLHITEFTEETIGFIIGPRFNAAGRLDNASIVVELLTSQDQKHIDNIIKEIEDINDQRKIITQNVYDLCIEMIHSKEFDRNQNVYVLYGEDFHEGVNGIVAARILDKYKKPTIIFSKNGDILKGSMRTNTLNCIQTFEVLDDLIIRSGGHENAGGLSIYEKDLDLFIKKINEVEVSEEGKKIVIDALLDYNRVTVKDIYTIAKLAPFGEGNPKPVFLFKDIEIRKINNIGKNASHTRIVGTTDGERNIDIIFFNKDLSHKYFYKDIVNICGNLNINDYNGYKKIQILGIDIKK